jgi:hypothetical protein
MPATHLFSHADEYWRADLVPRHDRAEDKCIMRDSDSEQCIKLAYRVPQDKMHRMLVTFVLHVVSIHCLGSVSKYEEKDR